MGQLVQRTGTGWLRGSYIPARFVVPTRTLGQLPPPPSGSQLTNFFSDFFGKLFGGDPTKAHDAGLQDVWLKQWAEPMAGRVRSGSLTTTQACALVDEGDRYAAWLLGQYQRTQSEQNILHTQVWPYWKAQLAEICAGRAPSEWPAGVPVQSGGISDIFNGGGTPGSPAAVVSSILPWALGALGAFLLFRSG
ncbi:MAG: hypothetical protein L0212_03820 [Acidobacteria bacterium]|nr:hypothetical protein [Acidobacteriota bacterium]